MTRESRASSTTAVAGSWRIDGRAGWALLVALVVAWDIFAPETLSFAFARGLTHRRWRWVVTAAWVATTLHLFSRRRMGVARNR